MKNAHRPLHVRDAYKEVFTMTQKIGAPQPIIALEIRIWKENK
jgi:hypothetical protein